MLLQPGFALNTCALLTWSFKLTLASASINFVATPTWPPIDAKRSGDPLNFRNERKARNQNTVLKSILRGYLYYVDRLIGENVPRILKPCYTSTLENGHPTWIHRINLISVASCSCAWKFGANPWLDFLDLQISMHSLFWQLGQIFQTFLAYKTNITWHTFTAW